RMLPAGQVLADDLADEILLFCGRRRIGRVRGGAVAHGWGCRGKTTVYPSPPGGEHGDGAARQARVDRPAPMLAGLARKLRALRSEEHTSELQSREKL